MLTLSCNVIAFHYCIDNYIKFHCQILKLCINNINHRSFLFEPLDDGIPLEGVDGTDSITTGLYKSTMGGDGKGSSGTRSNGGGSGMYCMSSSLRLTVKDSVCKHRLTC